MKVSLNWLKQFTDIQLSVAELVEKVGVQLGAVEEVVNLGERYKGIVVAKVVSCEKHTNADKLHVCKIDDGRAVKDAERDENGYVQVVCGAPNVREALLVAWIPPGVTVPSSIGEEPFVLEAREIRGIKSNGMLASAHELALGEDHSGILEIDDRAKPGDDFAKIYGLDDYVIDIENKMFTHRPDLFGQLGVAREIAGITGQQFASPKWYKNPATSQKSNFQGGTLEIKVENSIPELVPRFMVIALSNVEVKASPVWLQSYLNRVGIRPINNVVDITNYIMMETAQPLHAYDADKLPSKSLENRLSKKGEKLKLLGGKEIEFEDQTTILITSGGKPVGIGGVMGGSDTEISEGTKNIVLECANFDMYSVRKTAMRYGLFAEAVTRFNKGQSPLQNDRILAKAVEMLSELAGAKVASEVIDKKIDLHNPIAVHAGIDFINSRLGLKLSAEVMAELLTHVEFDVRINGPTLAVTPPFWRTDIVIPEDIVEEIGRLYGYDHLPLELPHRTIQPTQKNEILELKTNIRSILSKSGANEVLTYSFVHGNLLDQAGQSREQAFQLSNALSPDLQYYRLGLTPSLLEKVHPNIKAGYDEFAIFEMGKAHSKTALDEESLPKEFDNLALVITASDKLQRAGAAYYSARRYLDALAKVLGTTFRYEPVSDEPSYAAARPYDFKRSARIYLADSEAIIGMVGEFKPSVRRSLKLPLFTAGFEIGITPKLQGTISTNYKQLSKYPSVQQDITLKIPADLSFGELFDFILKNLNAPENAQWNLIPLDIYRSEKDPANKQITVRLNIASYEKTLKAEEVNRLLDELAQKAHDKLGATRV